MGRFGASFLPVSVPSVLILGSYTISNDAIPDAVLNFVDDNKNIQGMPSDIVSICLRDYADHDPSHLSLFYRRQAGYADKGRGCNLDVLPAAV